LLAAAEEEFAACGFDGAKVDRIAARARVNKAMLYYHFRSKAALYRYILRALFAAAAEAVGAVRTAGGAPETQLARYIETVARVAVGRPHFPAIWLREIAEGGRHLDEAVVGQMRRVLATLAAILRDGRRAGVFQDVPPLVTQVGIVAPLLMFAASAPVRARFAGRLPRGAATPPGTALVSHVQAMTLASLAAGQKRPRRRAPARSGART
jgi:TetR/AcrR family transcriptional regulator